MSESISVLGGTGALGRALALRLARAGNRVVIAVNKKCRTRAGVLLTHVDPTRS